MQIFTELVPKGLRAKAWAWLGKGTPEWQWSGRNRPPMSSGAKVAAHQEGIDRMPSLEVGVERSPLKTAW